jgi:ribosome-interacting GTPase 1
MVWSGRECVSSELTLSSLYVYNKIDSVSIEYLDKLAREPNTAVMSCELDLGIQDVVDRCWQELRLLRIYTKRYIRKLRLFILLHLANFSLGKALNQTSQRL